MSEMDTTHQETLLKFPCEFPLKIIGKANEEFSTAVTTIINKHVPNFESSQIKVKPSTKGTYSSITINIHAESKAQLDAIYRELSQHESIVMAL